MAKTPSSRGWSGSPARRWSCATGRSTWTAIPSSVSGLLAGPEGPASTLRPYERRLSQSALVDHLLGDGTGVEVGAEAADLAVPYLKQADAVVGDVLAVGVARGGPLEGGVAGVVGEDVAELALHVAEGVAVARPELAQAVVAGEGPWHRHVPDVAVFGVHLDEGLDVPVFFELPQGFHETVGHFFGHGVSLVLGYGLRARVVLTPAGGL